MSQGGLTVRRQEVRLLADPKRVIARLFIPGGEPRIQAILDRILALSDEEVSTILARVLERYGSRHKSIREVFQRHYDSVASRLDGRAPPNPDRRSLIGAYFTSEYSLESVALFNPSMVLHPEENGAAEGQARFIMSLRACGEGHISSIEFRSGVINAENGITFDPTAPHTAAEKPLEHRLYDKNRFFLKLQEMGAYSRPADRLFAQLADEFTLCQLRSVIEAARRRHGRADVFNDLAESMLWLACSSYHLGFPADSALSERIIFPVTENESRGIEDARFVRFTCEDGRVVYYGACTAYNGVRILPQLIETTDFRHFKIQGD